MTPERPTSLILHPRLFAPPPFARCLRRPSTVCRVPEPHFALVRLLELYTDEAMQLRKAARMILIGAPGVGKGTQTERMHSRYPQLSSISSGDLLRENVRQRTPLGMLPLPFVSAVVCLRR